MRLVSADWNFWPDGLDRPSIWHTSADLGFAAMEIGVYRADDELSSSAVTSIEALAGETGLGVAAVLFSMPSARWPDGGLGAATRSAQAVTEITETARRAADLGATVLGVWPGADPPASPGGDQWDRTRDAVAEVAETSGSLGLTLAIEYKPGQLIASAEDARRLVEEIAREGVGVLVDTAHAFAGGEDVAGLPAGLAPRLAHVHLGDSGGDPDADLPPGAEHDFAPFLAGLAAVGYPGVLSFDLYGFVEAGPATGAEASQQGLDHIRNALSRVT